MRFCKRKFAFLVATLSTLFSISAYAFEPPEMGGMCSEVERNQKYWVDKAGSILIGKVDEVVPHYPARITGNSSCWAKFKNIEWIKDTGPQEIWVESYIDNERKPEDIENLTYCEFKKGKTYIVYGSHAKNCVLPEIREFISTATDKGAHIPLFCVPNNVLYFYNKSSTINEVRNLMKE